MKVLLLPLLTIALLFTSCGDLTTEPEPTLEPRIAALEKRVAELEEKEDERLWHPFATLEDRLSQIERQLGIGSSGRLWNP